MIPSFAARRVLTPMGCSLGGGHFPKTGLVAGWLFDEAVGNAADVLGVRTLTNGGVTPFIGGKLGNCASLTAASGQSFSRASEAALQAATYDLTGFTFVIGMYAPANTFVPVDKGPNNNTREYYFSPQFGFYVWNTLSASVTATTTFNANTWIQYFLWFDPTDRKAYISRDNGVPTSSAALAGNLRANANSFQMGAVAGAYTTGRLDHCFLYGRVLTSDERTTINNGGAWCTYP